jgi:hypothetical protein
MNNNNQVLNKLIIFNQNIGIIRYAGPVSDISSNDSEIWYGIEWKDPTRGKHDGSFKGKRYFDTKHPTGGSFLNPNKANFGVEIWTAVEEKYLKNDDVDIQKNQDSKDKDQDKILYNNFDVRENIKLNCINLSYNTVSSVSTISKLTQMFPLISELDLENNLLNSWSQIFTVLNELKNIKILNVSNNILPIPETSSNPVQVYSNVNHLVLNRMNYTWADVQVVLKYFPRVVELKVCFNQIGPIESVSSDLCEHLKILDLESNAINEWRNVLKLGDLKLLEILWANNVGISEIYFPEVVENKTKPFPSLVWLSLMNNKIADWHSVNELNKLPKLKEISFKSNPLNASEPGSDIRGMFMAKIKRLECFNRTKLEINEKKGAEIDYLKRFGAEWFEICDESKADQVKLNEFRRMHPRYFDMVKRHGAVEKSEISTGKETVSSSLLAINLKNAMTGQILKKKLPLSIDIKRLKVMVCRLFKESEFDFESLNLTYNCSKDLSVEYELDNNMRNLGFYGPETGDTIIARKVTRTKFGFNK